MISQLKLFPDPKPIVEEKEVNLVIGGIYTDKDPENTDPEAPYCISFGRAFHYIFDGINHIDEIVEIGGAHTMKIVKGYALTLVGPEDKMKLQIRNSSIKGQDKYILWECNAGPYFKESIKKYLKMFHK